ncbi:MAG: LamG domain-containing protein [Candidatus Brocadiia bacterium]
MNSHRGILITSRVSKRRYIVPTLLLFAVGYLIIFSFPTPGGELRVQKALQPARELWRKRDLDGALRKIEALQKNNTLRGHRGKAALIKDLIAKAKPVLEAGYTAFNRKIGQNYPISLENGIQLQGKIVEVTGGKLYLQIHEDGPATKISMNDIKIGRILKLAAGDYPPDIGQNQAMFAVLLAMEEKFEKAEKALIRARKANYKPTREAKFVAFEKAWAKQKKEDDHKKTEKTADNKPEKTEDKTETEKKHTFTPQRGIVLAYSFEKNRFARREGGTYVRDLSSFDNHGYIMRATPQKGPIGHALKFSKPEACVMVKNSASLQIEGSMTVSFWMYPAAFEERRNPFHKCYGGEGTITLGKKGQMTFMYGRAGDNERPYSTYSTKERLKPKVWYHFALVRDLEKMQVRWYINGREVAKDNAVHSKAASSEYPLILGKGYAGEFVGLLDEMALWERALTPDEISQLFMYSKQGKSYCEAIARAIIQ